jgi:hypothetical protein
VTDTATVTESTTETDTATETATVTQSVTATQSLTATQSVTATDTRTAQRTTTRVVPLPGSTITRTLPGGTVVTTVVATPTSPTPSSTGLSAGAYSPGTDLTAPTGQRSLLSLWPYLLAMLALIAAGVLTWALSNRSSGLMRHNHR